MAQRIEGLRIVYWIKTLKEQGIYHTMRRKEGKAQSIPCSLHCYRALHYKHYLYTHCICFDITVGGD